MRIGSKTASACWLAIVGLGPALVAFGLGSDTSSGLRDTITELQLLDDEPTRDFVAFCEAQEEYRDVPLLAPVEVQRQTREDWAREQLAAWGNKDLTTDDFEVVGLLWCPLPTKQMTVREALQVVNDPTNFSSTLWPHSELLAAIGRSLEAPDDGTSLKGVPREEWKLLGLRSDIAGGAKISRIVVTSDVDAGTHFMFECANSDVFDPFTARLPTSPIQVIVVIGGSVYCFREGDLPADIVRLFGTSGETMLGLHRSYFGRLVRTIPTYSNKQAAEVDFDFPATRGQLRDIGSLTVSEALNSLKVSAETKNDVVDISGVKLPITTSLVAFCLALPSLATLFLFGLRSHGLRALPEVIQEVPGWLAGFAVIGAVSLLPSYGFFATGQRLFYTFPILAPLLQVLGLIWLLITSIMLFSISASTRQRFVD